MDLKKKTKDSEIIYSLVKELYITKQELEDETYWSSYWLDEHSALSEKQIELRSKVEELESKLKQETDCEDKRIEMQMRIDELQSELDEKLSIIDRLENLLKERDAEFHAAQLRISELTLPEPNCISEKD